MDFRPADGHVLFARVDMDADNSLRFAFSIETIGGNDALVFRNGGLFKGLSRDTRTVLVDVDESMGRYHFCAVQGGCEYVDAVFKFQTENSLLLDVKVKGQVHEHWAPTRTEARVLADPFPVDLTSQGTGSAGFPQMPTLNATVSWAAPLTADAQVWLLLSNMPCTADGRRLSRTLMARAKTGATLVVMAIEQIHAGDYKATAVLDADKNLGTTYVPTHGDGVTLPNQAVTVPRQGVGTAALQVVHTF
jgi:hypothetical protein